MSYHQVYYHIVFSTKNRVPVLHQKRRRELYNYVWGTLRNKKSHLYRIGGTEDHVHILTSIHSTVCCATLVRDLKTSCTSWIRNERIYPEFPGWQREYGAFTKAHSHRNRIIQYIKNQNEHHKSETFSEEFKRLLKEDGIDFDDCYLP